LAALTGGFPAGASAVAMAAQATFADSAGLLARHAQVTFERNTNHDRAPALRLWTQTTGLLDHAGDRAGFTRILERIGAAHFANGQTPVAGDIFRRAIAGAAATDTEVRRRLPSAPVVYLAIYGFAYSTEARARSSFVALSPDSLHDGLLTVAEELDNPELKLTADPGGTERLPDLIWAICSRSKVRLGLHRAFLTKGAGTVLVSLWNASDAATEQLITGCFQHWLADPNHPSKAEALRRAQEAVPKSPGFQHPRFWAAFQLVGAR